MKVGHVKVSACAQCGSKLKKYREIRLDIFDNLGAQLNLLTLKYVSGEYECLRQALTEPLPYFSTVPTLPLSEIAFLSDMDMSTFCSSERAPTLNVDEGALFFNPADCGSVSNRLVASTFIEKKPFISLKN